MILDYAKLAIVSVSLSGTTKDFIVRKQGSDYDAIPSWQGRKGLGGIASCRAVIDEDYKSKMAKEKPDGLLQMRSVDPQGMKKDTKTNGGKST